MCETAAPVVLLCIAILWLGAPRIGATQSHSGTVILVGDVLRFDQRNVWRRIVELAPDVLIVAAASDRPRLYGDFARRALQRHGTFAEVLPLAVDPAEFGLDHRLVVEDRALLERTREASGIFFVGGAPQRLAEVLLDAGGAPTPLGRAIAEVHATGGVIVGGIPGSVGLATGVDALESLASGNVSPGQLFRGLGLVPPGWFVDQHAFSPGRLPEMLVAMRQLGITRGIGVGADTAAVVGDGQVEVVGDEGVLLIDLSASRAVPDSVPDFRLMGARLSYLEHGDRFDMATLEVEPAAVKLDGFEIKGDDGDRQPRESDPAVAGDLLAPGRLQWLLREALDGSRREAFGLAFAEGVDDDGRGFRFRFHALAETMGWLSVDSGTERYTILNVGLDIAPAARRDMPQW